MNHMENEDIVINILKIKSVEVFIVVNITKNTSNKKYVKIQSLLDNFSVCVECDLV